MLSLWSGWCWWWCSNRWLLDVSWFVTPWFSWISRLLEAATEFVDALVHVAGRVALFSLGWSGFGTSSVVFPSAIGILDPSVLKKLRPVWIGAALGVVAGLEKVAWLETELEVGSSSGLFC